MKSDRAALVADMRGNILEGVQSIPSDIQSHIAIYQAFPQLGGVVLPGMRCFLKSCHDRGLKTALASASKNMPQFLHRLVWIFQFWELSIKTVSKWRFPVHLLLWKYGTHSTNAVSTRNEHLLRCW